MANLIHPAHTSLEITRGLFRLNTREETLVDEIIKHWKNADNSHDDPRNLITEFGAGLAKFAELPDSFKEYNWTFVRGALAEVMQMCEEKRIRVDFDVNGAVFK
jgi:hypothetical protein